MLFNGPNNLQIAPSNVGISIPIKRMVPRTHASQPPNCISIGSTVLAQSISVTNIQTHKHTDHATSDICHNRPHLVYACDSA